MERKRRGGREERDEGRRDRRGKEEGEERRKRRREKGRKEGLGQHMVSQKKIRQITQDGLCPEHFCLTSLRLHFAIIVYLGTFMMTSVRGQPRGTNSLLKTQNCQLFSLKFNIKNNSIRKQEAQNLKPDYSEVFLTLSDLTEC